MELKTRLAVIAFLLILTGACVCLFFHTHNHVAKGILLGLSVSIFIASEVMSYYGLREYKKK